MKKTKTNLLIILAMVMVLSLAFALIPTETFAQVSPIAPVDPPKGAIGPDEHPYIESISSVSYFSGDALGTSAEKYTIGSGTGSWSGSATANQGDGANTVLKVVVRNTGNFSYTANMTTYKREKQGFILGVWYKLVEYNTGTFYYSIFNGVPATDPTVEEIQSGEKITQSGAQADISIRKSNLSDDGRATIYFAFTSTTVSGRTSKNGSEISKNDQIVFSDMSFTYVQPEAVNISASTIENRGSITAVYADTGLTISDLSKTDKGATVTLTATPSAGNKFYYWTVDGAYAGNTQTISITADSNKTVVAEIRPLGYYKVKSYDGTKFWTSVKEFLDDESFTGKAMLLPYAEVGEHVLESSATLRAGVTLLVPYTNSTDEYTRGSDLWRSSWAINPDQYRYSKLVINPGVNLTVQGDLVVGAVYATTGHTEQALIAGNYGEIVNNGTITVKNGSDTRVYGLITGDGNYIAESGSNTVVTWVIIDFESGNDTAAFQDTGIFPFNMYSFHNIWCTQTINYGAYVSGRAAVYALNSHHTNEKYVIATESDTALLKMSSGSCITIDYDENRRLETSGSRFNGANYFLQDYGLMTLSIHGEVTMGSMIINVSSIVTVDSADYTFPVPYSVNINVESGGTLNIPNGMEFVLLPGSVVHVKEGGTLNVAKGGSLTVLDGLELTPKVGVCYPNAENLRADGFSTSGNLIVDGTFNINGAFGGLVQCTQNTGTIVVDPDATLGKENFMMGSDFKTINLIIVQGQSGIDNRVTSTIPARVARNSIANGSGVSNSDSFANLEVGKTYRALATVGGNTIQTKLTSFVYNQYSQDLKRNTNEITELTGALNSTITGTFYEWDSEKNKYIVPIEFNLGQGVTDSGVRVGIDGLSTLTDGICSNYFATTDGKFTANVLMDADGVISYYTVDSNGRKIGPNANMTAEFGGLGSITLTEVIKGAALTTNNPLFRTYDKDGNLVSTETLQGQLVYYGGGVGNAGQVTYVEGLGATNIYGGATFQLHGITFSQNVYQYSQDMALYADNASQLMEGATADNLVAKANALYNEWTTLVNSNYAHKAFIEQNLSSSNGYFDIYNTFAVAEGTTFVYGDTSLTVVPKTLDGRSGASFTVDVTLEQYVYDSNNDLITVIVSSSYKYGEFDYKIPETQVAATPKAITVYVPNAGHTYTKDEQTIVPELTAGQLVVGDELNQIVIATRESGSNAGTYAIEGIKSGERAGFYAVTFVYEGEGLHGVYTIAPFAFTISITGTKTVQYGETVPETFAYSINESVANAPAIVVTLPEGTKNVGEYGFVISCDSNYAVTTTDKFTITIRQLTVTVNSKSVTYGDDLGLTVEFTNAFESDKEALTNSAVFKIDGVDVSTFIPTVGTHDVTVEVDVAGNYEVTYVAGTLTVTQRNITVQIDNLTSVYGDELVGLSAQVIAGSLVEGHSLLDENAIISLAREEGTDAGDYAIVGTKLNANYNVTFVGTGEGGTQGIYTISKRQVALAIGNAGSRNYNGQEIDDSELSKTNFVWTGLIGNEDLSGNVTLSVENNGANAQSYTVKGVFAGNDNYAVTITNGTFTINQKGITVTIGSDSKVYDGAVPSLTGIQITVDGAVSDADKATLEAAVRNALVELEQADAGAYDITTAFTGNTNYNVTTCTNGKYTISKREIAVTIADKQSTYGDTIVTLTAATSDQLVSGHNLYTGANAIITLVKEDGTNAGTYKITAQVNNTNYNVKVTEGTYTISKRTIGVSIGYAESVYGDEIQTNDQLFALATVTNAIEADNNASLITFAVRSGEGTNATATSDVGTYNIVITAINRNYELDGTFDGAGHYSITKRNVTVTLGDANRIYNGQTISAQDLATIPVTLENALDAEKDWLIAGIRDSFQVTNNGANIGDYVVTAHHEETENYTLTYQNEGKFTITVRQLTIKIENGASQYGDTINLLDLVTVTGENQLVDDKNKVFSLSLQDASQLKARRLAPGAQDILSVGIYNIQCQNTNANYQIVMINNAPVVDDSEPHVVENAFEITKRQITITLGTGEKTYNGVQITDDERDALKVQNIFGGLIGTESDDTIAQLLAAVQLTVVDNGKDVIDGGYTVTGTFDGHDSYEVATITAGTFTINKKAVTVTVGNGSKVYDGNGIATLDDNVTIQIADAVEADLDALIALVKQNFVAIAESNANAQGYAITFGETTHQNYTITYGNTGKYVVTPRPISVTLDDKQSIYGDDFANLTASITSGATVGEDSIYDYITTITKAAGNTVKVGGYAITAADKSADDNYVVTVTSGTYTINPRPLTVTIAQNLTKVYDGQKADSSTFTYTVTDDAGVKNYDSLQEGTIVYTVVNSSANVGNYTIQGNVTGATNYVYTVVDGNIAITPRPISVTIDNKTSVYGDSFASLTATIASGEMVGEHNFYDYITLTKADGSAVKDGGYAITGADKDANDNYIVTFTNQGVYTITPRAITVAFGSITKTYGDAVATADELFAQLSVTAGTIVDDKQDLFTLTAEVTPTTVVGSYNVVATNLSGNYTITFADNFGVDCYTINAKAITLVVTAGTSIYGNDVADTTVTLKAGHTLVGEDAIANIYTVAHNATKASDVGNYPITTTDISDNYEITFEFYNGIANYTITKRDLTITLGTANRDYNDQTISSADLAGISVTFDDAIATDEEALTNAVKAGLSVQNNGANVGDYVVVSSFATHNNYNISYVKGNFTINKRDIAITIDTIAPIREEQTSVAVKATMSWENKELNFDKALFAIKDNDTIVAYIDDGAITFVDGPIPFGSYTVVLLSYDDENFNVTDFGTQTLEVLVTDDSYVITIDFDATSGKQYDNVVVTPTISAIEKISGDEATFTYTVTRNAVELQDKTIKDAGTYLLSVSIDGTVYKTATFTIDPRQIEIQIGDGQKTYDGLVISNDQRDAVEIEWSNLIDDEDLRSYLQLAVRNNGKDADDYTIAGTFAGNSNYVATIKVGTFTINKKAVTVTVGDGSKVYDGNGIATWDDNVTIQIPDAVEADLDALTALVKQKFVAITQSDANAQGYDITFGETTHQNYTITYAGTRKYTITPRPITVKVDNKQSIYGNEFVDLTAQLTGGTLIDGHNLLGENAIVSLAKADGTTVDSYTITGQCLNSNYDVTFVAGTYTINPRPITVTIGNATSIYGDPVAELTHSATSAYGIVSGDTNVYSVTCDVTSASNVGSYDITGVVGSNANYTVTFVNGTYTVTKRDITVTIGNDTKVYDGTTPALNNVDVTIVGAVNDADKLALVAAVKSAFDAINQVNVGSYEIESSFTGNANYNVASYTNGSFEIEKRQISVTIDDKQSIYGDEFVELTAQLAEGTLVEGHNLLGQNAIIALTKANGNVVTQNGYAITGSVVNNNYDVTFTNGVYTITKRDVTITLGSDQRIYNGQTISASDLANIQVTIDNVVAQDNSDLITLTKNSFVVANNGKDVATYTVTSNFVEHANYNIDYANAGSFEITKRDVTITLGSDQRIYNGQTISASDLANIQVTFANAIAADQAELASHVKGALAVAQNGINIGDYTVISNYDEHNNYNITYVDGKFTITPRPIQVVISTTGSTQFGEDLDLLKLVSVSGLNELVDEVSKVFNLTLQQATPVRARRALQNAQTTNTVGTYNILCENINENYLFQTINNVAVAGATSHVVEGAYKIVPRQVTLSIGNAGSRDYNGSNIALGELQKTGFAWEGLVGNEDLSGYVTLSIQGNSKNAGTYVINGAFAGDDNYAVTVVPGTFTINKLAINITVGSGSKTYDGKGVSAWDNNIAINLAEAVSADQAELRSLVIANFQQIAQSNVGSYAITFDQIVHNNYSISVVAGTYTINPRPITVTIDDATSIYGDQVAELTHSVTSAYGIVSGDTNVYSVTCDVTSASNVGSYDITGVVGSNTNYTVTFVNGTYTVTKRDITVTIGNDTKVYDGNAPILSDSISVTINGAVEADIPALQELVRGGFVAITQVDANADGYTIRSSFAGNNNYNAPTYANGKFVITKRGLTVTLAKANSIYGDDVLTSKQLYALATVQNAVDNNQLFDLAVLNGSNAVDSTNGVGLYDIVVVATSINDNYFIENVVDGTGLYQINPRPITVTINDVANHIYGNNVTSALLSAKITSGNAVNGDVLANIVKLETTVDNTTDVGSYPIDAQQLDDNYDVTVVAGKFTVVARPVTIVIENKSSVYGDEFQQATATVLGSSAYKFVNGDNLYDYVTLTNPTQTNVGTYDITGVDKAADDNYAVTVQSGKYTITARPIYIQIGSLSKVYDRQANDLSNVEITVWYVNADGENVDMTNELCGNVTINDVATQVVGSYTIQATFAGNNNYVVAQDGWNFGTLTITARPITVTIDDATSIYGETPAKLSANVTAGQVVTGDTRVYTLSCQVKSTTAVGEYQIVGANDNANYDITFVNATGTSQTGTYTVTQREISIKVEDATTVYATEFVTPRLTFINGSSLAAGDLLVNVVEPAWSQTNKVGSYQITAEIINNNYKLGEVQVGTYTVTPIALTVSLSPVKVHYGNQVLTNDQLLAYASFNTDLVAPADAGKQLFTLTAQAEQTDVIGNYNIVGQGIDDNYAITFVNTTGAYQIIPRPVTLLINDATSIYGNADAALTVTEDGNLVFGAQASQFVQIVRVQGTNAGSYYITATKVVDELTSNYDVKVTYTTGDHSVYTITPRPITVTVSDLTMYRTDSWAKLAGMFDSVASQVVGDDDLAISYKVVSRQADSGETIYFTEFNFSKEIRLGEFQIQAACGNANYDVEFEFGTLTVTLPKVAVGTITQNYTFNPEGIQIFNWQTQIVDYIPEITSDSAFVAKLMQNGNVIMSGNVLSGVVPAGEYTLVIEIVHVSQYEWQSGVVNSYPITVEKLDISDTIVEQGFTNGGWITNSSSGVSAMSQNNFNIYVDVTLSMDGQVVSNLTKCGNYTLTAVIDDANYCGQKTFSFRVIEDIAPTMAELNAMLNSYSDQADFATRMNKLTAMVELVATLNNDDAQLQIENNFIYKQLIQSVNTNWAEYVEDSKQDVQVASSVWQNVVLKAVATISLLSAAAFVAKRRLGL